jgi:voltage-gated potassium channel
MVSKSEPMHWRQLPNGRVTHSLEWVVIVLALAVVPVILIEESSLSSGWKSVATVANWVIWIGFAAELAFVATVAERKRAALRAHWLDIIIIVVSFPVSIFLLSLTRLGRLLRLLRLVRLSALGSRALAAEKLLTSRQGFRYVALATGVLIVVAGFAVSLADTNTFPNLWLGIWWAIATVTTVGYGDVVPHTVAGRVIASALMFVGIGFLSMLTAAIASTFVSRDRQEEEHEDASDHDELLEILRRIEQRLEALETK